MATRDLDGNLSTQIDELAALVAAAETVAGFTGAGISTESGVPDFRSPDSPWMRNKPIPFDDFLRSARPRAAKRGGASSPWTISTAAHARAAGISPSPRSCARGKMPAVITQNIDGLHQAIGHPGGARDRAARQRHLRDLPVVRPAP